MRITSDSSTIGAGPLNWMPVWHVCVNGKLTLLTPVCRTGTASSSTNARSFSTAAGLRPRYEVTIKGDLARRKASPTR